MWAPFCNDCASSSTARPPTRRVRVMWANSGCCRNVCMTCKCQYIFTWLPQRVMILVLQLFGCWGIGSFFTTSRDLSSRRTTSHFRIYNNWNLPNVSQVTFWIWVASSLVGEIITPYTKSFLSGLSFSFLIIISSIGITNARVLPDPVTASATTSLQVRISGITAAWIGVMASKPSVLMHLSTGFDKAGVTLGQSLFTIVIFTIVSVKYCIFYHLFDILDYLKNQNTNNHVVLTFDVSLFTFFEFDTKLMFGYILYSPLLFGYVTCNYAAGRRQRDAKENGEVLITSIDKLAIAVFLSPCQPYYVGILSS